MADNVPVKYLKDENNNIFAPQVGIESVFVDNENGLNSTVFNREIFLFHGYTSVASPALRAFTAANITGINFEYSSSSSLVQNGAFVDNTGIDAYDAGDYEITVRFTASRLFGQYPNRDIAFGLSVDGDLTDSFVYWINQTYDRCQTSFKWILHNHKKSTPIKFKYYCDAGYQFSLGTFEMWVKRIRVGEQNYAGSPVKYLKDENNVIFSPVTSIDAVQVINNPRSGGGLSLKNITEYFPATIYSAHYKDIKFTESKGDHFYTDSVSTATIVNGVSSKFLINLDKTVTLPLPKIHINYAGWYQVTVAGRIEDGSIKNHLNGDMWVSIDHHNTDETTVYKTESICWQKYYDRRGFCRIFSFRM